jgi:uncharacterized protein (DUF305 family)
MRKNFFIISVVLLGIIIVSQNAQAQNDQRRNAAERRGDHKEIRQDQRQMADDLRDAAIIESLIQKHRQAGASGDNRMLTKLHSQVARLLEAENNEAEREVKQAQREVRKDRREIRSDRREIKENRNKGAHRYERADDRRDLRDDRRDLADDRRDAAGEMNRKQNYSQLQRRWASLSPSGDLEAKMAVLNQLKVMARVEIRDNQTEKREDRRELREDRRETREDRRQR